MHQPESAEDVEAVDALRCGAESLDDDAVWSVLLAALDAAQDDGDLWELGDGFISESVLIRPQLDQRWREARSTHPKIAAVCRVMQDPTWNWSDADGWTEEYGAP